MCQDCSFVKFGFDYKGNQRLRCKVCGKTKTVNEDTNRISAEKEQIILNLHREKLSARAIARALNCSLTTVLRYLRKKQTV